MNQWELTAGIVAYVLTGWSFLQSSDTRMKFILTAAELFKAVYFFSFGLWISGAVVLFSGVRTALSIWIQGRFLSGFFGLAALSTPFWLPGIDWLGAVAASTSAAAVFILSGAKLRLVFMFGTCLWIANSITASAWVAVAGELSILVINAVKTNTLFRGERLLEKKTGHIELLD